MSEIAVTGSEREIDFVTNSYFDENFVQTP